MNDSNSTVDYRNQVYRNLSSYCGGVAVVVCTFGCFGNSLSLYVFTRYGRCRGQGRSINLLLSGLSFSDLFLCIVAVPVLFIRTFFPPETQEKPPLALAQFYNVLFIYGGPLLMMFQTMSVWLLVLITIERYLAVCRPLLARAYCRKRRTATVMVIVVILIILYISPRFWNYREGENNEKLVPFLMAHHSYRLWYVAVSYLILLFTIPFCVLSTLSARIITAICNARTIRRTLTDQEIVEHDTTRMLLAVVTVFVVCYTPSALLNFVEVFNVTLFQGDAKGNFFNDMNNVLIVFNSASSVLLYIRFCRRYRRTAYILLLRCCRACGACKYTPIPIDDTMPLTAKYLSSRHNATMRISLERNATLTTSTGRRNENGQADNRQIRRAGSTPLAKTASADGDGPGRRLKASRKLTQVSATGKMPVMVDVKRKLSPLPSILSVVESTVSCVDDSKDNKNDDTTDTNSNGVDVHIALNDK